MFGFGNPVENFCMNPSLKVFLTIKRKKNRTFNLRKLAKNCFNYSY